MQVQLGKSVRKIRNRRFLRCWVLPYLRSRIRGGFRPILGCVYTEWKCNLECAYCDRHTPMANEMSRDQILKALGEFVELGTRSVSLDGGDPRLVDGGLAGASTVSKFAPATQPSTPIRRKES